MTTIVYPGTFDPITNGHTDLVQRAASLFEHVIVAVAANPSKVPAFSEQQRTALVREVLADFRNVEVCSFDTLLVDFATSKKCHGYTAWLAGGFGL